MTTNSQLLGGVKAPQKFFSFPNPVNEWAARTVATGVFTLTLITLATGWAFGWGWYLSLVLFAGFLLRVAWGPKYSPLGRFATQVAAPRLNALSDGKPILVPGPPKRFAQAIGATFTGAASITWLATGSPIVPTILLGILVVFAGLEAFANFCAGCWVFGKLMKFGIIPESVCESCADVTRRYGKSAALA